MLRAQKSTVLVWCQNNRQPRTPPLLTNNLGIEAPRHSMKAHATVNNLNRRSSSQYGAWSRSGQFLMLELHVQVPCSQPPAQPCCPLHMCRFLAAAAVTWAVMQRCCRWAASASVAQHPVDRVREECLRLRPLARLPAAAKATASTL